MALIPPRNLLYLLLHQERLQAARQRQRILIAAAAVYDQERAGRDRRARTVWVKPWLKRPVILGQHDTLMAELMRESCGDFKAYLRMQPEMFHEILVSVAPHITKSKKRRPALDPGLKLAITLRFLATGNSYHSLAFDFWVAHKTILLFVPEVCDAIVAEFKEELMTTPDEWKDVCPGGDRLLPDVRRVADRCPSWCGPVPF